MNATAEHVSPRSQPRRPGYHLLAAVAIAAVLLGLAVMHSMMTPPSLYGANSSAAATLLPALSDGSFSDSSAREATLNLESPFAPNCASMCRMDCPSLGATCTSTVAATLFVPFLGTRPGALSLLVTVRGTSWRGVRPTLWLPAPSLSKLSISRT